MTNTSSHRQLFAIAFHYYYMYVKESFVVVLVSRRLWIQFLHCLLYNSIIIGAIFIDESIDTFNVMGSTFTGNSVLGSGGMRNYHVLALVTNTGSHRYFFAIVRHYYYVCVKQSFVVVLGSRRL